MSIDSHINKIAAASETEIAALLSDYALRISGLAPSDLKKLVGATQFLTLPPEKQKAVLVHGTTP